MRFPYHDIDYNHKGLNAQPFVIKDRIFLTCVDFYDAVTRVGVSVFENCVFQSLNFRLAAYEDFQFEDCEFSGCDFTGSSWKNVKADHCRMSNCIDANDFITQTCGPGPVPKNTTMATLTAYNPGIYTRYASAVIQNTEFRTWAELEDAITRVGVVAFENCDFLDINAIAESLPRKWGTVKFSDCNFDRVNFNSATIQEDFHFTKCVFGGCDFIGTYWGQDLWVQNCQFTLCVGENHFKMAASVFTPAAVQAGGHTLTATTPSWSLTSNYVPKAPVWPWTVPEEEKEPKKDDGLYGPDDCKTCGHTGEKHKMAMWCTHCSKVIWGI